MHIIHGRVGSGKEVPLIDHVRGHFAAKRAYKEAWKHCHESRVQVVVEIFSPGVALQPAYEVIG